MRWSPPHGACRRPAYDAAIPRRATAPGPGSGRPGCRPARGSRAAGAGLDGPGADVAGHPAPGGAGRPGAQAVERVLDRVEALRASGERDDAAYARLRRSLRRVPPVDREARVDEARILVDALFQRARTARRTAASVRCATCDGPPDSRWSSTRPGTCLGAGDAPPGPGPARLPAPVVGRDESGCVARDRSSDPPSRRARLRVVREQRHVAGAGPWTGKLIAHDDDVDLAVVLAGAHRHPRSSTAGSPSRTASQRQVCSRLDFEEVLQSHCKLVAAGGLSVDLFPAWTADDRVYAWPVTCGGSPHLGRPSARRARGGRRRGTHATAAGSPARAELRTRLASPDPAFTFDWADARRRFDPFLSELRRAHAARA